MLTCYKVLPLSTLSKRNMKVVFNQNISGANFYYLRDQVVDLPADIAKDFLNAGFCDVVEVKQEKKAERAVSKKSTKRTTRAK